LTLKKILAGNVSLEAALRILTLYAMSGKEMCMLIVVIPALNNEISDKLQDISFRGIFSNCNQILFTYTL
jgi:hypothetical protein